MKKSTIIELLIWLAIIIVAVCALFFAYLKVSIEPNLYSIQFNDIDGITKGSPVRFMGINVGYVRSLKSKDKHINVQIVITKKNMEIPNGTSARVEFYGLGGSKSVELMPPDDGCSVGILTDETIRLNDVVHEAIGLVEIVEMAEKYVKNINKKTIQKFLVEMKNMNSDKIKNIEEDFGEIKGGISKKAEIITKKQDEMTQKVKEVNENVEKFNEFIKK